MSVTLPYTCGELVQGTLDGDDFLVTCPIARYGTVSAWLDDTAAPSAMLPPKTRAAVRHLLPAPPRSLHLRLPAALPSGKGLGASSVDVVGTLLVLSRLAGRAINGATASRMALAIEPTDAIACSGIVLFNHRHGGRQQTLGAALPLKIIVVEPPSCVDTVNFNRRARSGGDSGLWRDAVAMIRHGLAVGDAVAIARAATLSALHWQRVLYNPWLAPALAWGRAHGALGICRAHSGSALGILFAPGRELAPAGAALRRQIAGRARVWTTSLADGGIREEVWH